MTMFDNGLHPSISTTIVRFMEQLNRDEMKFAHLTQEAQDIGNKFRFLMSKFYAGPAKSTRAAKTKMDQAKRMNRTTQPPL